MTLPEQSDRAVAQTRQFLVRLASPYVDGGIKGIRREVRAEALRLLRHYPYAWLSQNGDCPEPDNAANRDILTAAEREAVCMAMTMYEFNDNDDQCAGIAATLRGLMERLSNPPADDEP
jgi:hypothetical protein